MEGRIEEKNASDWEAGNLGEESATENVKLKEIGKKDKSWKKKFYDIRKKKIGWESQTCNNEQLYSIIH